MTVTHCLGPLAAKLRRLPMTAWGAALDKLPKVCPNGCKVHCRAVCTQYARDQRELAGRRA